MAMETANNLTVSPEENIEYDRYVIDLLGFLAVPKSQLLMLCQRPNAMDLNINVQY